MERRLGRETKVSLTLSLQKKMAETRRKEKPSPDLTDFMNDMFFGAVDTDHKTYNLTGSAGAAAVDNDEDEGFDDSTRSNSARLTQEWLKEARRMVASSPSRGDSPTRTLGSPRFAAAQPGSPLPSLDRRDALSRTRSARRYRVVEGISDEILAKTAKHTRNKSDTFFQPGDGSPATAVHSWFSNILKPNNNNSNTTQPPPPDSLPPRQHLPRKSRFQTEPSAAAQGILSSNSRRTLKTSVPSSAPLTCSQERVVPRHAVAKEEEVSLNGFLKEQRILFHKISRGELRANAQIVLSGPTNSTASMVAAICHAWLLSYRQREKEGVVVVVPVMNVKRDSMWKLKQAAWLFHHAALDSTALLFTDEVDMESLLMTGQLSVLVVGQDILSIAGEVGSQCTVVTDNYCEDAYDLLQNPVLKKLLLAGILLDTQNLKASASISMTRDAEAVQLLLVGSVPNYRYALFDHLMQDQKSASFVEAMNHNYRKPPGESEQSREGNDKHNKVRESKSSSLSNSKTNSFDTKSTKASNVSPNPVKLVTPPLLSPPAPQHAEKDTSRGKNKFFLARWLGFGSK